MRIVLLTLVGLALFTVACGGSGSVPDVTIFTVTPLVQSSTPGAVARPGQCRPARPHESGDFNETLPSGGVERAYILHVPSLYDGGEAVPLVVNLHGYTSNAQQQAVYSGFLPKADQEDFVVVTPQGTGEPTFWNIGVVRSPDDIAFMSDLLDAVEAELCVDTDRVYAAGMSNGAAMSVVLACKLSDRIAAFASVTGTFFPRDCTAARPVPGIAFHGTDDPVVPFEGGPLRGGLGAFLGVRPIEQSVADWAGHNGCANEPHEDQVTEHVRSVTYGDCDEDAIIELYVVEGGGHTWPGSIDVPSLGETTHEISATDLIWEFFKAHPRHSD